MELDLLDEEESEEDDSDPESESLELEEDLPDEEDDECVRLRGGWLAIVADGEPMRCLLPLSLIVNVLSIFDNFEVTLLFELEEKPDELEEFLLPLELLREQLSNLVADVRAVLLDPFIYPLFDCEQGGVL